jgi:hypothetical protein
VMPSDEVASVLADVGARLRRIRAQREITLTELAAATGISRSTLPHWFGAAGDRPVEILSQPGKQGERIHVRAAPRARTAS